MSQWIAVVLTLVLLVGICGYVLGLMRHREYFHAYMVEREMVRAPEVTEYVPPPSLVPTVVNVYVVAPQLSPVYSPSLTVDAGVLRGLPCGEWVVSRF